MVLGFLALAAVATAFGLGTRYGVIDASLARRGVGTVVGAMFVLTGNFLPKMRPLNTPGGDPASTTAAERVAGLDSGPRRCRRCGTVPLRPARPGQIHFVDHRNRRDRCDRCELGMARAHPPVRQAPNCDGPATPQRAPTERRRIMIWLLFAIFYLALTACVKAFVSDPASSDKVGTWLLITFRRPLLSHQLPALFSEAAEMWIRPAGGG